MFKILNFRILNDKEWRNLDALFKGIEDKYKALQKAYISAEKKVKNYFEKISDLKNNIRILNSKIIEYKLGLSFNGYLEDHPEDITLVDFNDVYQGDFHILTKKGNYKVPLRLKDYFQITSYMEDLAKRIGITKEEFDLDKFFKALWYVQENLKYMHDKDQWGYSEQFTPPWITLATGKDDCESLATATIGLYLAGGGNPNNIFLGLGIVEVNGKRFGHGFPVFYQSKEDYKKYLNKKGYGRNAKWWIGEATYFRKYGPVGWDKVKNYKAVWGLSNPFGQYLFVGDEKYNFKDWQKRKGQPDLKNNRW